MKTVIIDANYLGKYIGLTVSSFLRRGEKSFQSRGRGFLNFSMNTTRLEIRAAWLPCRVVATRFRTLRATPDVPHAASES